MDNEYIQIISGTCRKNMCISINDLKFSKYRMLKSGDLLFHCTNKKCNMISTVNSQCITVICFTNEFENQIHTKVRNSKFCQAKGRIYTAM